MFFLINKALGLAQDKKMPAEDAGDFLLDVVDKAPCAPLGRL